MAVVMEQQQSFKHFCRICKKGFVCGRALGGHMRAHGIGDEPGHIDDDDPASNWKDKLGGNPPGGSKRMYALRTNPNRLKSCRICGNCGKEFSSWKSFLEHGKCSSDDAESLVSYPGSDDDDGTERKCGGWSKGKRSRRVLKFGNSNSNCPSSEEEDLANWLVMLSTARVDPSVAETEESCASASKEEERNRNYPSVLADANRINTEKAKGVARGLFECKACKKVFDSHQALGGHRASHKQVKGCSAAKLDDLEESLVEEDVITHDEFLMPSKTAAILPFNNANRVLSIVPSKRKSKVHECSICHRIFASGQALGGHKRCHWVTANSTDTSISKIQRLQEHSQLIQQRLKFSKSKPLDLNLPTPDDDLAFGQSDNENQLHFEVPTGIYLQQWIGVHSNDKNNDTNNNNSNTNNVSNTNNNSSSMLHADDEADTKIKLAKLSDLRDMNMEDGPSPWLQVGIGSTANVSSDP